MDAETRALAAALRARLEAEDCSLTFRELWDRYAVAEAAGIKDFQQVVDLMKAPLAFLGDKKVDDIRRADWIAYREARAKQTTRFGMHPSVATRNLELQRVKRVFNWAIEEGLILASPLSSLKRESPRPMRETTISEDSVAKFLEAAEPIDAALLLLGVDCGLRRIEGKTLKRPEVGAGGRITVRWTVSKTRRSRPVILTSRVLAALERIPPVEGSDYYFASPRTGEPYSDVQLWSRFRTIADALGIPCAEGDGNMHFHDSRHTFVTRTIENGTPPAVAMRAAGHTTFQQASRYFHLSDHALEAMRERNEAALAAASAAPRRPARRAPPAFRRIREGEA